ncbi:hypothetical protein HYG81_05215 [Natrinema zhouii]|uniref:Uncharacterized protein n=1 Tax=Natrinema zhouii TaxID=1710539 RepID=A0A7D6CSJ1_9EURY|nr:hypothetical protein [Natrinema zhouii]QLK27010.1 hypothetical protein HYG81_05215 [Natrinema zhouii]
MVSGRHVFEEVDASGIEAVKASVDASTEFNDVYVTDDEVYVLKHALSDERRTGGLRTRKMARAVGTAISELSVQGKIVGLRPVEEITPTAVQLDEAHYFSDAIEASFVDGDPRDESTDAVVYVLPTSDDISRERVISDLRTVSGVRYAVPDDVRIVDNESAIPEPDFS